jgi:hypothetical protein
MIESTRLRPGTRVRLRSSSHSLELQSNTGYVVRPAEWLDYFIVRLDKPAQYRHASGETETLEEIRVDADNMEVLEE